MQVDSQRPFAVTETSGGCRQIKGFLVLMLTASREAKWSAMILPCLLFENNNNHYYRRLFDSAKDVLLHQNQIILFVFDSVRRKLFRF